MKKQLLAFTICTAFLINSTASAVMSPKRLWECATEEKAKKNKCTESEQKTARGWIIGASITAIIAVLVAIGIIRGPQAYNEGKRMAADAKISALQAQRLNTLDYEETKKIDNDIAYWKAERSKYID